MAGSNKPAQNAGNQNDEDNNLLATEPVTQPDASRAVTVPAKTNGGAKVLDLKSLINGDAMRKQFALALPKICTPERFTRVALTALNKTPKLLNCTRESVLSSLMTCAELGIEPDGRRAHLIPYGNACTLIIDYKGLVELAMRSGMVSNIHADKICQNDVFRYNRGRVEEHTINFREARGKPYAYYCLVTMKDGAEKSEVMTVAEIDAIRKRSKAGNNGPWVDFYDEMAKKTVFRRAAKWIPQSPELRDLDSREGEDGVVDPSTLREMALPKAETEADTTDGSGGLAGAVAE